MRAEKGDVAAKGGIVVAQKPEVVVHLQGKRSMSMQTANCNPQASKSSNMSHHLGRIAALLDNDENGLGLAIVCM